MPAPTSGTLIGPAGLFNGTNQYLTRTDAAGLGGQTAVTWFGFCQATAANVLDGIFGQGPLDGVVANHGLAIWWAKTGARGGAANCAVASIRTASGYMRLESSAGLQSTTAMGLCLTYASGQLPQLYKDGAADAPSWVGSVVGATATKNGTLTGAIAAGTGGTHIGTALNTTAELWAGALDEIWLRAGVLTPEHVAAQHQAYADPEAFLGYGSTDTPENANLSVVAVPDVVTATKNVNTDIPVLDNDYEPGGGTKTLVSVGTPTAGTATKSGSNLRYNSGATFTGFARCTYVVSEPGGKQSTGLVRVQVIEPAAATSYDIDLTKAPWKNMDEQTVTGSLADVVAAASAGPQGRFYNWTGTSNTTYAQGTTITWAADKGGTAAAPKIIRVMGSPGAHKTVNARLVINAPWSGIYGVQLSGRAAGSMLSLIGAGSRVDRCRITAWGHRSDAATISEGSHAILIGADADDAAVVRCEIDNPLDWTTAEIAAADNFQRGLLKMGIRIPGDNLGESPLRFVLAYSHMHDFPGRPGGVQTNYNKGQNDFFEGGFSHTFTPGQSVASIVDTVLFENNPETSGIIDFKSPGWLVRRIAVRNCPGGNTSSRGNGGANTFESCWFDSGSGGLTLMGPNCISKGTVCEYVSAVAHSRLRMLTGHSAAQRTAKPGSTRAASTDARIYGGNGIVWIGYDNGTVDADEPATGTKIWGHTKPTLHTTDTGYYTKSTYSWSTVNGAFIENTSERFDPTLVASPIPFVNGTALSASAVGINS